MNIDILAINKMLLVLEEIEYVKKNHLLKKRINFRFTENDWLIDYLETQRLKQ